jgi:hypothetical protein
MYGEIEVSSMEFMTGTHYLVFLATLDRYFT